jgi:hypothetical protein
MLTRVAASVHMAVTCQVGKNLPVLIIASHRFPVSQSSLIDRSGGTMF